MTIIMMRPTIAIAAVVAFAWASPCRAQSVTPQGIADRFAQAWSTHDRAAFDRHFTEDAHFIPTYDLVAEGRANVVAGIYQGHQDGTGPFRETTLTTSKVSVQQLGADAAVVHFNVSIHLPPDRSLPPLERTLHLVVVKQPDGWKIASGQLTKPNCAPGGGAGVTPSRSE
jgi:uncharacterized protein (TIGR02246 family)